MQDLFLKLYASAKLAMSQNDGQAMAEYAMAVALIAFGCVAGEAAVATSVNHTFIALATTITTGVAQ
jgi:Flp pilus assembly pilin Flp